MSIILNGFWILFFPMENNFSRNLFYFWIFPISLKSREIRIFQVPSVSCFGELWGESFRHSMFVGKMRTQVMIKLPVFIRKNAHNYITILCQFKEGKNCKIFLVLHRLGDSPTVFGTDLTYFPTSKFNCIFSSIQKYFHSHWSIRIFFTSGIGRDILMNVFEDCIVFVIWTAWVLFNFNIK